MTEPRVIATTEDAAGIDDIRQAFDNWEDLHTYQISPEEDLQNRLARIEELASRPAISGTEWFWLGMLFLVSVGAPPVAIVALIVYGLWSACRSIYRGRLR